MRIQNNITAMNTHRQYTINNDNVAKSAEKLSSGYRINRAADDAAGLAISEKMRSQIRGLNMATKNSQDAISLVQTAEGALQETHSMLQRMNELAVQAATGTNQDFDKVQAAKEFEQLKREINDVAESTTFNNMKILDGSLSYTGPSRSAATAGINVTKPTPQETATAADAIQVNAVAGKDQSNPFAPGTAGVIESASPGTGSPSAAIGDTMKLTLSIGTNNVDYEWETSTAISSVANLNTELGAEFGTAGKTVRVDGTDYKITWDGASNKLVATQQKNADGIYEDKLPATSTPAVSIVVTANGTDVNMATASVSTNSAAGTGNDNTAAVTTITSADLSKIKAGDSLTVGDKTINFDENNLPDDINDLLGLITTAAPTGATATKSGDAILVTAGTAGSAGGTAVAAKFTSAASAANKSDYTMEFDIVKMRPGDSFTFTKADGTSTDKVAYEAGMTANEFATKVAEALGQDADDVVKGNAIVVDWEISANLDKADWGATSKEPNAMMIQVGALENEQLAISIDSMNTAGLSLDSHNLETQGNAGKAITAVRAAVNKVSDQRATLGAMQNRLDHKIANLKVSSENLSAAESRIRDVDMAQEMTNFTKNNILSQAATAMLAQANALPQNVLSLLG